MQTVAEPRLYDPSSQGAHPVFKSFTRVPAPHERQLDAPEPLYDPVGHVVHVEVPPTEKAPAEHVSQPVLSLFVLFPAMHDEQ